ncbi:4614_t:CDS:2, partial [Acaulospora colombiana]
LPSRPNPPDDSEILFALFAGSVFLVPTVFAGAAHSPISQAHDRKGPRSRPNQISTEAQRLGISISQSILFRISSLSSWKALLERKREDSRFPLSITSRLAERWTSPWRTASCYDSEMKWASIPSSKLPIQQTLISMATIMN